MLSVGTYITNSADALKKVSVEYLYHSLRNPRRDIEARIRQLRIVRNIDKKQYSHLKRQLPYIVCAAFNPPYRRTENFAYTEYFIVDIDHLSEKGMDIQQVRRIIEGDEQIILSFISPGEDGLKLLFRLKERCFDAGIYSLFYKAFIRAFSAKYNLEQVVDERTCDVCRACFISIDSEVFYRKDALPVDLNAYIDTMNVSSMFQLKKELDKELVKNKPIPSDTVPKEIDPDKDAMSRIKALLNPKLMNKSISPPPIVPQELDDIIGDLVRYIEETGIVVYEIKNIQYAKKIKMKMGMKLSELNLFYGKHGFSVVQSPRCGTSAEFNKLSADLVKQFLQTQI